MTDPRQSDSRGWSTAWMIIICIWAGSSIIVVPISGPYLREQRAIRSIAAVGGIVNTRKGGPDWLRRLVGDGTMQVFDQTSHLHLTGPDITDSVLEHLSVMWLPC